MINTPEEHTKRLPTLANLPPGTAFICLEEPNFEDPSLFDKDTIYLFKPLLKEASSYPVSSLMQERITLIILGDGDDRFADDLCRLVESLQDGGIQIENFILSDLHIDCKAFSKLLSLLQKDPLSSLKIQKVPLYSAHLSALEEVRFDLKNLSLNYTTPDAVSVWDHDLDQCTTDFKGVMINPQNFGSSIRFLELKGFSPCSATLKHLVVQKELRALVLSDLRGEFVNSFLTEFFSSLSSSFENLSSLSLRGTHLNGLKFPNGLPRKLCHFDLNDTALSEAQIYDLCETMEESSLKLSGLHLSGSVVSAPCIKRIQEVLENKDNHGYITELEAPHVRIDTLDSHQEGAKFKGFLGDFALSQPQGSTNDGENATFPLSPPGSQIDSAMDFLELDHNFEETEMVIEKKNNESLPFETSPHYSPTKISKKLESLAAKGSESLWCSLLVNLEQIRELLEWKGLPAEERHGLLRLCLHKDADRLLPLVMKDVFAVSEFLLNARSNLPSPQFFRPSISALPKNDFAQLPSFLSKNLDRTMPHAEDLKLTSYQTPLIERLGCEILLDDQIAEGSLQIQRQRFLDLMLVLGYSSHEVEREGQTEGERIVEDVFHVLLEESNRVAWDFKLATFSVVWDFLRDAVSVRFNLSDDWFLERAERTNVYQHSNCEYLVAVMSEINLKRKTFFGCLDVPESEKPEVILQAHLLKVGTFNIPRELFVIIDEGFVTLKALQHHNIFDLNDSNARVAPTSEEIGAFVKKQAKSFRNLPAYRRLCCHLY